MAAAQPMVKVGVVVLLALAFFVGLFWYLSHYNPDTYELKVAFADTSGLVKQTAVRMRGVQVGEVRTVELVGLQPIVTLAIENKVRIPKDSQFAIITGLLILNPHVEITPGQASASLQAGDKVVGAQPKGALESLSPELAGSVTRLNTTMDQLQSRFTVATTKINHLLDKSSVLIDNVNQTVTSTRNIVGDARLRSSLFTTVQNFQDVSENAKSTAVVLRRSLVSLAESSKGTVTKLTGKLGDVLTRIDSTIDQANTVVRKLTEQVTDPRLQQSLQETAELARTTLARFDQIAADVHQLTGDAEMQSDLKQSVSNLRSATDKGQQAITRVNALLGAVTGGATSGRKIRLPQTTLLGNISEQLSPTRLRVDVDARIATGRGLFDVGLYDLGQNTRLTLQGGLHPSDAVLLRYGLYASKIGVGLEWEPVKGTGLRGDLYDTSRPRLDLKALFRVNNDASLWLGADGIFRHPSPILGIQFKK